MSEICFFNEIGFDSWARISVDKKGYILLINEKAEHYFPAPMIGKKINKALPWFKEEWLNENAPSRVVKISQYSKLLMETLLDQQKEGHKFIFFKNVDEYRNLNHLWCEVEDSLIRLQPFIDNSHDAIIITNGMGIVRAINHAFCQVSGIQENDLLGKSLYELSKQGLIPDCSMMHALEHRRMESSVVEFPHGKETVVSSKPLCDKQGNIIRVISNVRDITELKALHEKLRSVEAIAKQYQRELNAKNTMESNLKLGLHRSRIMEDLYERVKKVADTDLPLVITGESGVGKTALARYIHASSDRNSAGNFVHINCSAIPESLLESELFGYEAGAFTGAKKMKIGLFESAQKGTVFLDEIGDMPLTLQAKLLNVLQEKAFYRVGGTKLVDADVRLLAATNQTLEQLISEGRFRRDLYFRLNVIPIKIPALRERREDIAPLLAHFLEVSNKRYKRSKILSTDALTILLEYNWPGNIRELMNVVERIVVLTGSDLIEPRHLPAELLDVKMGEKNSNTVLPNGVEESQQEAVTLWSPGEPLKKAVSQIEGRILAQAIAYYGSAKEAAKNLGVDESTITRKRSRNVNVVPYTSNINEMQK
jgi:PAS domain S-box-containing protein